MEKGTVNSPNKPPLSFEKQAEKQIEKYKLEAKSEDLTKLLSHINYYRFDGFLYEEKIRKENTPEVYKKGTNLDIFYKLYFWDRKLCSIVTNALCHIEISFKTRFVNYMACQTRDPYFYTKDPYQIVYDEIKREINRAKKYVFEVKKFSEKYTDQEILPAWIMIEFISFGSTIKFFQETKKDTQESFIKTYYQDIRDTSEFENQMKMLLFLRNTCAHHGRLIFRKFPKGPKTLLTKNQPNGTKVDPTSLFARLLLINEKLKDHVFYSEFSKEMDMLFKTCPVPLNQACGTPSDMNQSPYKNWFDIPDR